MTAGNYRWAKYGKIGAVAAVVTAVVVGAANLDGFLSMIDRLDGPGDSVETAGPQQPQQTTVIVSANPPTIVSPLPEVPPSTHVVPPPPVTTVQQRVTTPAVPPPTRAGALVMNIRMGSSGKVGPSEYRAGARPGANVDVYDDIGQLSAGCYPSWTLTRDGTEVQKSRNGRCTSGGITMFNFGDSLDVPGSYRLSVDVVTDGGQVGSSFVDFAVR